MSIELGGEAPHPASIDPDALGIRALLGSRPVTEIYEGYAGVVFNYIDSMQNDKGIDLAISVKNQGAIESMADDDVLEITCLIGKDGAKPMRFANGELNESNLALMKTIKRYERLTVEAVRTKSKAAAREALMQHPLVGDYALAKALTDEYAAHNAPWIGEWK